MNAAFVFVTSAWLAGQAAAPPPAAPKAPPPPPAVATAPAACGASCGGDCNACCDSCGDGCGKGGLFGRFRGLFNKGGGCDSGCGCDDGCGKGHMGGRLRGLFHKGGDCCEAGCGTTCAASSCCDSGCDSCGKQGLFGRLRGLFRKGGDCCDSCCDSGCGAGGCGAGGYGAPAPGMAPAGPRPEPIQAPKDAKPMPKTTSINKVQVLTPEAPKTILTSETETKNPFELHRRSEQRVGHAPDYSCLTGQLFYVHADGGLWVLRYAPLWQEDPNGGSIVLARDLRMANFHEGDLVTVHGEIVRQKSTVFLGGPLYRARSIELVERGSK